MKDARSAAARPLETPQWITFRFERGTHYYSLHLQQDLWGAWCLTRVNGRKNSRRCRSLTTWPGSLRAGIDALAAAVRQRRLRGYRMTG